MVPVLHKELEYKMEKLKYKKFGGHAIEEQKQIRTFLTFQLVNKLSGISPREVPHKVLQSWLINAFYHLLMVKNNQGKRWGA